MERRLRPVRRQRPEPGPGHQRHIDEEHRIANVTVPERMLSLAIGREGQNARLAARLTGWRIDIRSDVSVAEAKAAADAVASGPSTDETARRMVRGAGRRRGAEAEAATKGLPPRPKLTSPARPRRDGAGLGGDQAAPAPRPPPSPSARPRQSRPSPRRSSPMSRDRWRRESKCPRHQPPGRSVPRRARRRPLGEVAT